MTETTKQEPFSKGAEAFGVKITYPDLCPRCGRSVVPQFRCGVFRGHDMLQACFRCTSSACDSLFIVHYPQSKSTGNFDLGRTEPVVPRARAFSQEIADLSQDFVEIYNDAVAAELYGLRHVVGVGLRKALEFLIKDYCKKRDSAASEQIEKKLLGRVIEDHVKDERVKQTAKRAVWLGNDETHYVRKWVDKDINDLKALIELTVRWIESEELTEKLLADMPEGKP